MRILKSSLEIDPKTTIVFDIGGNKTKIKPRLCTHFGQLTKGAYIAVPKGEGHILAMVAGDSDSIALQLSNPLINSNFDCFCEIGCILWVYILINESC